MSQAAFAFHSPLSLLREWRDRADGARLREFLVTGYTLDLVFFERHCVSLARGLGARISVLGDAGQPVHEPVDVRHAGRTYQHGHARCAGAFHPKLVVLIGDEDVWVAIGSGNPTMSGWGHNHELWLVLRAYRQRGPRALRDLGDWLIEVPEVVAMPSWLGATVEHIGRSITPSEVDDSLPNLRIFGNLRRSVVEQLPSGPVRSLRLTAPDFDGRSQAVRALVTRLSPGEVDIAVQRTLSQYNGQTLSEATSSVPRVGFWFLDEDRTSHGKLVEWFVGEVTTALVGSANLSFAAMLATTEAGGNCELMASYPVSGSLLPEGTSADRGEIQGFNTITAEPRVARGAVLTVLGARRLQDVIVVELVTTASEPITIETSPDGTPGTWMTAHVVPADEGPRVTARFRIPEQLGGAVRARVEIAGERIVSSEVFLTDTSRCLPRDDSPDRPKLVRDYDLDEVFTDPVLASRFSADLLRLLGQVHEHKAAAALRTTARPTVDASVSDDRWGTWLQDVERSLGPSLTSLVFPGVHLAPEIGQIGWTVGTEVNPTELAEGEDEDVVDTLSTEDPGTATARAPVVPPSQRHMWRTTARRLRGATQAEPRPRLEFRMTVALLYLNLLAAGVWGADESWRAELRDVIRGLVPTDEEFDNTPSQALSFLSSLAAVCLALLFQDATPHGGSEHDLIAKSAWDKTREWVGYAELLLVEGYLYVPEQSHARVASESEVAAVIDLAMAAAEDPHAELRIAFDHEGLPVEWIDGVWVADSDFRNPRRIAARVATLAGPRCAVLARNARTASLILRDGNTLAIAESTAPLWRIYQLTPVSTPLSIVGGDEGLPRTGRTHPLEPVPRQIRDLAETVGAHLTHLLAALHESR
jgi:hypothetical protein